MATALKVSPHWLIVRATKNAEPGERSTWVSGEGCGGNAVRPMNPGLPPLRPITGRWPGRGAAVGWLDPEWPLTVAVCAWGLVLVGRAL